MNDPGRRRSTLCRNGLSATPEAEEGDGDGEGAVEGELLALGRTEGSGVGRIDGVPLGDGEAEGLGVGFEQSWFWVPVRNSSPPHPRTTPDGCEYQSRMLPGRAFTQYA